MPWLKVDGKSTLTLATALVDVACRIIVDLKHGHEPVRVSIRTRDVRVRGADAVHSEADPTSILRDDGGLLQGIVDALD